MEQQRALQQQHSSIAAAMSMAAKGTHYFPCTLARHNFCIFFVSSIRRFPENIIAVSSEQSPVLTQYNKVLGVPDLFEVSGFVDRIFWSALSGYPGAVNVGGMARENKKSQLCCDCLLCVHLHLLGDKVKKFGKHYLFLLNCVYWMVQIANSDRSLCFVRI